MSGKPLGKTTSMKVSAQVHDKIMEIKNRNGHTTVDSVLRSLLIKQGEKL